MYDNMLILSRSEESVKTDTMMVVEHIALLGFAINWEKSRLRVINTIQSARAPSTSSLMWRSEVLSLNVAEALALSPLCVRWGTCLVSCNLCWRKVWLFHN